MVGDRLAMPALIQPDVAGAADPVSLIKDLFSPF
jgi:hypothetical protein